MRLGEVWYERYYYLFPGRLTAGRQVLVLTIGVRIPAREPTKQTHKVGLFCILFSFSFDLV